MLDIQTMKKRIDAANERFVDAIAEALAQAFRSAIEDVIGPLPGEPGIVKAPRSVMRAPAPSAPLATIIPMQDGSFMSRINGKMYSRKRRRDLVRTIKEKGFQPAN